jgi:hypothetical protein
MPGIDRFVPRPGAGSRRIAPLADASAHALSAWASGHPRPWIRLDVTYELTEDRLILRKGLLVKSIDEIELYRVKDVRMDFTLINQWAGSDNQHVPPTRRPAKVHSSCHVERTRPTGGRTAPSRQAGGRNAACELDVSSEML